MISNLYQDEQINVNNLYQDEQINVNNLYQDEKINVNNLYQDEQINVNNLYQEKYLKYKKKYIKLKKGGADSLITCEITQKYETLRKEIQTIYRNNLEVENDIKETINLLKKSETLVAKIPEKKKNLIILETKAFEKTHLSTEDILKLQEQILQQKNMLKDLEILLVKTIPKKKEALLKLKLEKQENENHIKEYNLYNFYIKISYLQKINPKLIRNLYEHLKKTGEKKIGSGSFSKIYSYTESGNKYVLSLQHEPTYNVEEIELLLYLNTIKLDNLSTVFSEFINIFFDFDKLQYYLCYKYYTGDLYQYLLFLNNKLKSLDLECTSKGIPDSKSNDTSDSIKTILNKIEDDLNIKFKKLLQINYICLDIKLKNILVSYDELRIDYTELVLHDYDLIGCCKKENLAIPNCTINDHEKEYLEIYYKLIIYFQCNHYNYINKFEQLPIILYKEYFKDNIPNKLLESFFEYILKDRVIIPDPKVKLLEVNEKDFTHKRIFFYFNNYIILYYFTFYNIPQLDYTIKQFMDIIKGIANDEIKFIKI